MNNTWFKRVGILFIPASIAGWLILAGAIAYAIHVFIGINRITASTGERIFSYVLNLIIIFIGYSVVGYFTSKKDDK